MHLSTLATALLFSVVFAAPARRAEPAIPVKTCPRQVIGGPFFAPVPESCTQYYFCDIFGFDEIFECNYPEVFNPDTGECTTLPSDVTCVHGTFKTTKSDPAKQSSGSVVRRALWRVPEENFGESIPEDVSKDVTTKNDDKEEYKDDLKDATTKDDKEAIVTPKDDEEEGDPKNKSGVAVPSEEKNEDPKDDSGAAPFNGDKKEGSGPSISNFRFDDKEELDNYGYEGYRQRYHRYRNYSHGYNTDRYRQDNGWGYNDNRVSRYEGDERGYYNGREGGRYEDDQRGNSDDDYAGRYEGDERRYHDDEEDDYYKGYDEHM